MNEQRAKYDLKCKNTPVKIEDRSSKGEKKKDYFV